MSTPKNQTVLYLSYDGLSDHIGQSQVLPYLLACSEKGIRFHILTFEKKANAEKVKKIQALLDEKGIRWYRLDFTTGRNMLFKVWDFIQFVFTAFRISIRHRYAIIHSRSYFASSIGLLIKTFLRPKLIFDKRDFWIDAVVETGRLNPSRFSHKIVYKLLRFFERRLFLKSTHIISLTENAKNIVLQQYPSRKPEEITVIPCCVDLSLFDPAHIEARELQALRDRFGLNGATVLGYVGSIGPAYMVPELLACFKQIKQELPKAKLFFLVNNDREEVVRVATAQGVAADDIIVTSAQRSEMPLYISLFDFGIFFITPTFAKKATSPTKLYEMLAMNKPIVTNSGVGDAEKIFSELGCGYLVPECVTGEFEKAAHWLSQNGGTAARYNLANYSLQYGAQKYFGVYQQLLAHA